MEFHLLARRLWVVLVLMPYTSALVTGEPSGQFTGTANRGKTGGGLEATEYGLQCRALTGLSVERIYNWEVPGNAAAIVIHLSEFKHPFVTRKRQESSSRMISGCAFFQQGLTAPPRLRSRRDQNRPSTPANNNPATPGSGTSTLVILQLPASLPPE